MSIRVMLMNRSRLMTAVLVIAAAWMGSLSLAVIVRADDPSKSGTRDKPKPPPQTAVKEASPVTSIASSDGQELPKPPIDEAHPLYLPLQGARSTEGGEGLRGQLRQTRIARSSTAIDDDEAEAP